MRISELKKTLRIFVTPSAFADMVKDRCQGLREVYVAEEKNMPNLRGR